MLAAGRCSLGGVVEGMWGEGGGGGLVVCPCYGCCTMKSVNQ